MILENQVCSLEPAKKLKELGIKQVSIFAYIEKALTYGSLDNNHPIDWESYAKTYNYQDNEWCSAFTVAELGEMLPKYILRKHNEDIFMEIEKITGWQVFYRYVDEPQHIFISDKRKTLADAMAKMLIYLIENNLIKVEDI